MKGAYFQFMRIALKLLIGIYWHQRAIPGFDRPEDDYLIAEAQAWLEANK